MQFSHQLVSQLIELYNFFLFYYYYYYFFSQRLMFLNVWTSPRRKPKTAIASSIANKSRQFLPLRPRHTRRRVRSRRHPQQRLLENRTLPFRVSESAKVTDIQFTEFPLGAYPRVNNLPTNRRILIRSLRLASAHLVSKIAVEKAVDSRIGAQLCQSQKTGEIVKDVKAFLLRISYGLQSVKRRQRGVTKYKSRHDYQVHNHRFSLG